MSDANTLSTVRGAWDTEPPTLLISTLGETHAFFNTCPHAQTYEAYSQLLKATVWIPLPCRQWSCRFCANNKIAALARKCEQAKPNRLLTLTVDPQKWDSPRDAFDGTRRKVPELFRRLRGRYGDVEYLRVTELTRRGWPHYHCLLRSVYLPQPVVKALWQDLTGATIVDLRQVKNHFHTYQYLVKYLSKMHRLGWTNRHVSYSRSFFPEKPGKKADTLRLVEGKVLETHPATLAYHRFRNSKLVEISYGVYTLNPSAEQVKYVTAPESFAPQPPEAKQCPSAETPTSSQKSLPTR